MRSVPFPPLADFLPPPGLRPAGPPADAPWLALATALEALAEGRADEAWRRLRALPPGLHPEAEALAAAALRAAGGPRLDLPADFARPAPGKPFRAEGPHGGGAGNDFAFLTEAARRADLGRPLPRQRLRLVLTLADAAEVRALAAALARYLAEAPQPPELSLCLMAPAALHGAPMPVPATWQDGQVWRFERDWQLVRLAEDTDGILFLPLAALDDPFLPDRAARWLALSASLCLALVPADPDRSLLADPAGLDGWTADPAPFLRLAQPWLAVSALRFRALRGFDPRFVSALAASRDLAFRLAEAGGYVMPLPVRAPLAAAPPAPEGDAWLLAQTCPSPALPRAAGERFQRPRLSLCLPFLPGMGAPVLDALADPFQDLEICLAAAGPDEARRIPAVADPRLRCVTLHRGTAAACAGQALAMARGRHALLMAADERLDPGALAGMVARLEAGPDLGHLRAGTPPRLVLARRQAWNRLDPLPFGLAGGVIPERLARLAPFGPGAEAGGLGARAPDPRLSAPPDPLPPDWPGGAPADPPPAFGWLNPRWAAAELPLASADRLEAPLHLAARGAPDPAAPLPPEPAGLRARARELAAQARARAGG